MRWAIVGSGTRNARAISAVVSPPSKRSVSATRASVGSTGWQAVKIRRSRSSPMSSSMAASKSGTAISLRLELAAELLVLALEQRVAAQQIDRAMLRRGHEPGAWIVRDARLRPLLERGDERVLRELLGQADVAHDAREAGDEPGRTRSSRRRRWCDGYRWPSLLPITPSSLGLGKGGPGRNHPGWAAVRNHPLVPVRDAIRLGSCGRVSARVLSRLEYLANFTLAIAGYLEELLGQFNSLQLRVCLKQCEAADHFLGFTERPVGYGQLSSRAAHPCAKALGRQPSVPSR